MVVAVLSSVKVAVVLRALPCSTVLEVKVRLGGDVVIQSRGSEGSARADYNRAAVRDDLQLARPFGRNRIGGYGAYRGCAKSSCGECGQH
jgi:hypothetical protein